MPYAGIAIIVGFIIILVLCIIADKNTNKKFQKKFEEEHQIVDSYGSFMITSRGELLYNLPSGTLKGYKAWNLSDITAVSFATIKKAGRRFSVDDANGKAMKGEYLTPSRKPLKEKAFRQFDVRLGEEVDEIINLIRRNAGHIKFNVNGKEV